MQPNPTPASAAGALADPQRLPGLLARYRDPILSRTLWEIAITVAPFLALWAAMWVLLKFSILLTWLLAPLAAAFLVRIFLIQHDCGHGSLFRNKRINDWVGRLLGVLTFTPYDYWKRTHAAHHAGAGNLDRRGIGDIDTLTVKEYLALNWRGRLRYRLYRHPLVMFGIGPAFVFLLQQRAPFAMWRGGGWTPWISTMATNVGIAALAGLMIYLVGPLSLLAIHGPIFLIAASAGIWLFYVQHQFEDTRWAREVNWNLPEAALHGSSHYDLPYGLRWFSANIGVHHVHHLASRVPFYRLTEVLRDYPELKGLGRLTLWQSLSCIHFSLWDEDAGRLISFRTLRKRLAA